MPRHSPESTPREDVQKLPPGVDKAPDTLRSAGVAETIKARKALEPAIHAKENADMERVRAELDLPPLKDTIAPGKKDKIGLASIKAGAEQHLKKAQKDIQDEAHTPSLTYLKTLSEHRGKTGQEALLKSIKRGAKEHLDEAENKAIRKAENMGGKEPIPLQEARLASIKAGAEAHVKKAAWNKKDKASTPTIAEIRQEAAHEKRAGVQNSSDYKTLKQEAEGLINDKNPEALQQFVNDLKREANFGEMGMQEAAKELLKVYKFKEYIAVMEDEAAQKAIDNLEDVTEFAKLDEETEQEEREYEEVMKLEGKTIPFLRTDEVFDKKDKEKGLRGLSVRTEGSIKRVLPDKTAVIMEYTDSKGKLQEEEVKIKDLLSVQESTKQSKRWREEDNAKAFKRPAEKEEVFDEEKWFAEPENTEAFEEMQSLADAMTEHPGDALNIKEARSLLKSKKGLLGKLIDIKNGERELPMDQAEFASLLNRTEQLQKDIDVTKAKITKEKKGSWLRRIGLSSSPEQKKLEANMKTDEKDLKNAQQQIDDFMAAFDEITPKHLTERGRANPYTSTQERRERY